LLNLQFAQWENKMKKNRFEKLAAHWKCKAKDCLLETKNWASCNNRFNSPNPELATMWRTKSEMYERLAVVLEQTISASDMGFSTKFRD